MSDIFRDRSCMHWWLPHDEGYPPIIRTIRKFVEDRTAPATNVVTKDLQDMKTIFASLRLDDGDDADVVPKGKSKEPRADLPLGANQELLFPDMSGAIREGEGDGFGLYSNAGNGLWVQNQEGEAFRIPEKDSFP